MSPHPRKFFLPLVLLLALLPALAEQEKKGSDETRPDIPIEQGLKGPDRTDFKWKAELLPARLTFQQRNLVQVRALLDVEALHGDDHHDFYFLLKIADEKGSWLPDETFNHYPLPPGIDKKNEIQYSSGFYTKPGKYTAALLLYDVATAKGNVWHRSFEVKAQKNDPLPELDRHIPTIEFITEVPTDALPSHDKVNTVTPARGRYGYGFGYPPIVSLGNTRDTSDLEWPPGHGFEVLPVRAPRPLRVDVILNLAPHIDPFQQRRNAAGEFRAVTGRMLQIGALLSHLQVDRGCVRVSAVDMSKLTTVFKPQDGLNADWDKLTEQARKVDHNTVS